MNLRSAENLDLAGVAALHKRQFSDHFLGQYSECVLDYFYAALLGSSIFLIAEEEGRLLGFVVGGDGAALGAAKRRFAVRVTVRAALETVVRPRLWRPAGARLATLVRGGGGSGGSSVATRLLSIAVDEDAKGMGVAAALVRAFEAALTPGTLYGLSVLSDNVRAVGFYLKMGFAVEKESGGTTYFVRHADADADR